MQSLLPINPVGLAATERLPAPLQGAAWSVGQRLSALVIGTPERNFTRLAIGEAVIEARTAQALQVGERLALRVAATRPSVVLQIESSRPPATQVLAQALARTLPVRASIPDTMRLMSMLDKLARATPGADATAPRTRALTAQAAAFIASLPAGRSLDNGPSLQRAVLQSALPAEATLARLVNSPPRSAPETNAGTALRRLANWLHEAAAAAEPVRSTKLERAALPAPGASTRAAPAYAVSASPPAATGARPSPPAEAGHGVPRDPVQETSSLRTLVAGTLARVQTHHLQLAHQSRDAVPTPGVNQPAPNQPLLFNVELPVLQETGVDLWRFEFEGEQSGHDEAREPTRGAAVTLELRLDGDVEVRARIAVHGERVDVRLDTNDEQLLRSFARHSNDLAQRFAAQGLETGRIDVESVSMCDRRPIIDGPLIDESI